MRDLKTRELHRLGAYPDVRIPRSHRGRVVQHALMGGFRRDPAEKTQPGVLS